MPNARDATATTTFQKLLVLGPTGSGKTTQIWTLPGRKFLYAFDPNALLSLRGCDIDYEEFLPDALELDATLKGFNKGAKDDTLKSKREPSVYMRWVNDLNKRHEEGFFKDYQWLCIDSLTLLANAVMDRQMFINGRYGGTEDLADYRVAGSKIAEVFRSICSLPINLYCTGHITSFQDDKTKRIETQINLPGKARNMLPMLFSNIWLAAASTDDKVGYVIHTKAEARGFQAIRTTIPNLPPIADVNIKDFNRAGDYGIGGILKNAKSRVTATPPVPATQPKQPQAAPGAAVEPAAS